MELTTIVGVIAGVGAVIGAMFFKGVSFSVFNNPAALLVIFVGTIACILNAFPGKDLKSIGKLFGIIFTSKSAAGGTPDEIITTMVNLSSIARKEGLLSLEGETEKLTDPFMKKGMRMVVDGATDDYILDVLSIEIDSMKERHANNAMIFTQACAYAPTLGVLGAVFGLIAAMGHIDDTEAMSHAIAAAFVATILGIFTGYVLWGPFANKLKMKSKAEVMVKNMVIEGLLSIQKGDSPAMVRDKLIALLPAADQTKHLDADPQ